MRDEIGWYPTDLQLFIVKKLKEGMREKAWFRSDLAKEAGVNYHHLISLLNLKCGGSMDTWDKLLKAVGYEYE